MSVLSDADIVELRAVVSDLFPDRADVYHRQGSGGSVYGGSQPTYPDQPDIADVPVLFGTRSVVETQTLALQQAEIDQVFTFPGGVDIRQTDKIVVGGNEWQVTAVGGGGSWEVTKLVGARRQG